MYRGQTVRLVRNTSREPISDEIFAKYEGKEAVVVTNLDDSQGYSELTALVEFLEDGYEMHLMVSEVDTVGEIKWEV